MMVFHLGFPRNHVEGIPLCSLGLQSGEAGFQTRGNARYINFGALALVASAQAINRGWSDSPFLGRDRADTPGNGQSRIQCA
jgi:hypothetical protein